MCVFDVGNRSENWHCNVGAKRHVHDAHAR